MRLLFLRQGLPLLYFLLVSFALFGSSFEDFSRLRAEVLRFVIGLLLLLAVVDAFCTVSMAVIRAGVLSVIARLQWCNERVCDSVLLYRLGDIRWHQSFPSLHNSLRDEAEPCLGKIIEGGRQTSSF